MVDGVLGNFFVVSDINATVSLGGPCPCNKEKSKRNSILKGFHCPISQDLFSLYFASQVNKFCLPQLLVWFGLFIWLVFVCCLFVCLSLWENQEEIQRT